MIDRLEILETATVASSASLRPGTRPAAKCLALIVACGTVRNFVCGRA